MFGVEKYTNNFATWYLTQLTKSKTTRAWKLFFQSITTLAVVAQIPAEGAKTEAGRLSAPPRPLTLIAI